MSTGGTKTTDRDKAYDAILIATLARVLDMLKFAEAKNAALLAFSSAWIIGLVNLLAPDKSLPPGYRSVCQVALPLFIIAAMLAIISLLPKVKLWKFLGEARGQTQNLLFFGDIAECTVEGFRSDVRRAYYPPDEGSVSPTYLNDLEVQIAVNSRIASRKYRFFNWGAAAALTAIAAFVIPTLAAAHRALTH
jgi:hypothetical protein